MLQIAVLLFATCLNKGSIEVKHVDMIEYNEVWRFDGQSWQYKNTFNQFIAWSYSKESDEFIMDAIDWINAIQFEKAYMIDDHRYILEFRDGSFVTCNRVFNSQTFYDVEAENRRHTRNIFSNLW